MIQVLGFIPTRIKDQDGSPGSCFWPRLILPIYWESEPMNICAHYEITKLRRGSFNYYVERQKQGLKKNLQFPNKRK